MLSSEELKYPEQAKPCTHKQEGQNNHRENFFIGMKTPYLQI